MSAFTPAIRDFLAAPNDARRLGPYLCKELLDKAGTAPVFRAAEEHAGLNLRDVAVKVFDIGKSKSNQVVDQARALCRVQHPNVIRFHTLSTDPKRGLMGLVMEFAEGISVDRQLEGIPRGDARRIALAVEVGINIASALEAAHEAGVVHCNVKPSNIMYTDGTHKLINFGIAPSSKGQAEDRKLAIDALSADSVGQKAATLDKAGVDAPAPVPGTIGYVDPICLRTTTPVTAASDLYSLGATLYQCIAGDVPAVAKGKDKGIDKAVLTGEAAPTPLAEIASSAPADLAKLVDSLVAPARKDRPRSADVVRRSLERIRSVLAGRERSLPPEDRGPFPGLDRYEASDRDVFLGRSAEVAGVIESCRTRGLVGIVGLSGSGKSSITRAGIVPAIEEGALGGWPTKYRSVLVTPGNDLMKALDESLSKVVGAPLAEHPEEIAQQLAADVDAKGEGIVILVDQLEEVVLKHDAKKDDARLKALDLLSRLAEAPVGLRVIVAVRRDLLDGVLAVDPHFSRALSRGIQLLGPLTGAGWEEVVDQGLEAYGYSFEDAALRKDVLANLKDREGAMTLAQFGLTRLWATRSADDKKITREGFTSKDGMKGALGEHADAAIAKVEMPREKLRVVLLAMTTPEGTRAHVPLEKITERFGNPAKDAVLALAKARLVASETPGFTFVHDSILREWSLLRGWIADARDDRLLLAHIERDAARWVESRDPADLLRKGRLAAAVELWKRGDIPLSDAAKHFVTASHKEAQKAQFMRWGAIVVIVGLIVGGSLFYAKLKSDSEAQARKDAQALAAALADVKRLKHEAEENAMEAAASAKLLHELQKQMTEERASYGKDVQATLKKVASAKDLEGAQKATEDLKSRQGPAANAVVPLPPELMGGPSIPKVDPGGPSPSPGGGTFDQAAIERVVATRKAGVKRVCLERSASTASTTKVTASLTIAPNGTVQGVNTSGDDPQVAKCIEQQLHGWTFPAPGETKTVQIPFVFVRQ